MQDANQKPASGQDECSNMHIYKEIVDRAHAEVQWVHSAYKYLSGLIAVLFVVGIGFTYKSGSDFKNELRAEFVSVSANLKQDLDHEFSSLKVSVEDRIDSQFDTDNIRALVEAAAERRTDAIADEFIKLQISERITPVEKEIAQTNEEISAVEQRLTQQLASAEAKQLKLDETLTEARAVLNKVEVQMEFVVALMAADHDDRAAFEKLVSWSKDTSYSNRMPAEMAVYAITRDYAKEQKPALVLQWQEGIDPSTFTLEKIKEIGALMSAAQFPGFVVRVAEEEQIAKAIRIEFLVDVMEGLGNSLQAANFAGWWVAREAGLELKAPFDFKPLIDWWEKNQQTYRNESQDASGSS